MHTSTFKWTTHAAGLWAGKYCVTVIIGNSRQFIWLYHSFLFNLKQVKYYHWGSSPLFFGSDTKEMLITGTELWILSDPRDQMIIWLS